MENARSTRENGVHQILHGPAREHQGDIRRAPKDVHPLNSSRTHVLNRVQKDDCLMRPPCIIKTPTGKQDL